MALTDHEKEIIVNIWSMATKDMQAAGISLFKQFFEDNPTYQNYFSFRDVSDWETLKDDKRLKAHAANVMYTLEMLIKNINDIDVFVEMVDRLAKSHVRRKLNVEHFENLKVTLVKVLINAVGASVMNSEAISAWAKAYSVITDIVLKRQNETQ